MTASVTVGRALRYADGSARGLLHHERGHGRDIRCDTVDDPRIEADGDVIIKVTALSLIHI